MTTIQAPSNQTRDLARSGPISAAWIAGGLLWFAAGLIRAADGWRFTAASIAWLASDILLLVGLVSLLAARPHRDSAVGTGALYVAIAARVLFAAGEVASLAAGNDAGPLIPLGALLSAVSLTTYGIVVLRRWTSAPTGRWAFLAMGLYPVVAMFPVLAITGEPNYLLIAVWGVPAILIGVALGHHRHAGVSRPT